MVSNQFGFLMEHLQS